MLTTLLIYDSSEIKVLKQYSKNISLVTPIKCTKENPDFCVISTDKPLLKVCSEEIF